MARGKVTSVVKVVFCGNCGGSAHTGAQARKRIKTHSVETNQLSSFIVSSSIPYLPQCPTAAGLVISQSRLAVNLPERGQLIFTVAHDFDLATDFAARR